MRFGLVSPLIVLIACSQPGDRFLIGIDDLDYANSSIHKAAALTALVQLGSPPAAQPLPPSTASQDIPLREILKRMSQMESARAVQLKQYTSVRIYELHNLRFNKTAQLTVRLTYRSAEGKHFEVLSESGPHVLCQRVLRQMVESEAEASRNEQRRFSQITAENYDFHFARLDRDGDRSAYVLDAVPKTKSRYLMRGQVWVDMVDFAISTITGQPAKNPSFWIRSSRFVYHYGKFDSFWLPLSMKSEADALVFGRTEVNIDCRSYRINSDVPASAISNWTLPSFVPGLSGASLH